MKHNLTPVARRLRRAQTDAERELWMHLRMRQLAGHKFRRQHEVGRYVVDFACIEAGVIVELDGGQHVEQVGADRERTTYLESFGFRVLRFWNDDVLLRTADVLEVILRAVASLPPHPNPLPLGERASERRRP